MSNLFRILLVLAPVTQLVQSDCTCLAVNDPEGCPTVWGYYPICNNNNIFAQCVWGVINIHTCPASLIWDCTINGCVLPSATTTTTTTTTTTLAPIPVIVPVECIDCVSTCTNTAVGYYRDCNDASAYVQCDAFGGLHTVQCAAGLVFDDIVNNCVPPPSSCDPTTTTTTTTIPVIVPVECTSCVDDCSNTADGYYNNCNDAQAYVRCAGGVLHNQACAAGQVWDDKANTCVLSGESSCDPTTTTTTTTSAPPVVVPATCVDCFTTDSDTYDTGLTSCVGVANGNYAQCGNCFVYVTCSNENLIPNRLCPSTLRFNDNTGNCQYNGCGECELP